MKEWFIKWWSYWQIRLFDRKHACYICGSSHRKPPYKHHEGAGDDFPWV